MPSILIIAYLIFYLLIYVFNYFGYDLSGIFNSLAIEFFYLGGLIVFNLTFGNLSEVANFLNKI